MSTSTPNFDLIKPAGGENVDIATINSNMDKIDAGVEPVHKTSTVTGGAGSVTITNPLDAPVLDFTATGIGAPGVFYMEGMTAQSQGAQDWDTPLVLDVPIGIIDMSGDPVFLDYGGGVGANTYKPTAGTEAGTTIWWNSAQLGKLFDEAEEAGDEGTTEAGSMTLFTWTLPFSVAENSVVYCSHLKNQNVSGEEGIWASGNHMYFRISQSHLSQNDFSDFARLMRTFANKVNYYDPFNPKGTDPENWLDFWIMATPAASYTKESDKKVFSLSSGSQMFLYFKITDYIAMVMEQQPSPTALTSVSVKYLNNVAANITQNAVMANAISAARQEPAALGEGASANGGGAIGTSARETNGGGAVGAASTASFGAAIGVGATESNGGAAVGFQASSTSAGAAVGAYAEEISGGGAIGYRTKATSGGAVGHQASETYGGGAVGSGASTTMGGAVGNGATATSGGAVGYGTNVTTGGAVGTSAAATTGGAIGNGATATSGFAGGESAGASGGGGSVGYQASTSAGGAVGLKAKSTPNGGAVGQQANAGNGGAVGYQANATSGGAVGQYATCTGGGAIGWSAKTSDGAAIGKNAFCADGNTKIDAIQLGTGTNSTAGSMQVYSTPLLIPDSNGGLVIPPALLIASVGAMTPAELALFKQALGIS